MVEGAPALHCNGLAMGVITGALVGVGVTPAARGAGVAVGVGVGVRVDVGVGVRVGVGVGVKVGNAKGCGVGTSAIAVG